jgi:hypothetical protein
MKLRHLFPLFLAMLLNLAVCLPAMAVVAYDRINVTSTPYNAIPNDGIDDTTAIMNAINAGTASSKSIYFPPGTYNFTGLMTLPANKSYRIYGDGQGVSTILFTGPNAGINAPSMGLATLNVEGLTLQANSTNCGTAIYAAFNPGAKFRTASIQNVQIIGSTRDGVSGTWWTNGISLFKAINTVIDKVHISGNKNSTVTGITYSSNTTENAHGLQMSNLEVKWCNSAFLTSGYVEGIYLSEFEFISCGRAGLPAVYLYADQGPTNPMAGGTAHLVNGKIDSIGNGLTLEKFILCKVSNVSFTHAGPEATHGTMLVLNTITDAMVTECTFNGVTTPYNNVQENGVYLMNAHLVRIAGNNFNHMQPAQGGSCIVADSASTIVRITDNLFSDVASKLNNLIPPNPNDPYYNGNFPVLP